MLKASRCDHRVSGGYGTHDLMADDEVLEFLRRQAQGAQFVTSVCTGSIVLGAAGLLKGCKAAAHWSAVEVLPILGATISRERVCTCAPPQPAARVR
jgi:cyclohexyl-isocyanide hydratase